MIRHRWSVICDTPACGNALRDLIAINEAQVWQLAAHLGWERALVYLGPPVNQWIQRCPECKAKGLPTNYRDWDGEAPGDDPVVAAYRAALLDTQPPALPMASEAHS